MTWQKSFLSFLVLVFFYLKQPFVILYIKYICFFFPWDYRFRIRLCWLESSFRTEIHFCTIRPDKTKPFQSTECVCTKSQWFRKNQQRNFIYSHTPWKIHLFAIIKCFGWWDNKSFKQNQTCRKRKQGHKLLQEPQVVAEFGWNTHLLTSVSSTCRRVDCSPTLLPLFPDVLWGVLHESVKKNDGRQMCPNIWARLDVNPPLSLRSPGAQQSSPSWREVTLAAVRLMLELSELQLTFESCQASAEWRIEETNISCSSQKPTDFESFINRLFA